MSTQRNTPINLSKEEFKVLGHSLIDEIAELLDNMDQRPVTSSGSYAELQGILGKDALPEQGAPAQEIMTRAVTLLRDHSLFNGHPKFMGFITSSPTPIGILGDMLAAAINPNVGGQILSPMATEIEKQTISWLAEFIGVGSSYGGLLVSGGNMANLTAFRAAITAKAPKDIKEKGLQGLSKKMICYCPKTTHTWIDKAAILFGLGSDQTRWISTDDQNRMDIKALEKSIQSDLEAGHQPFMVIGNAGDVSTGIVDDLKAIAATAKKFDIWFHIDGAYGAPAAVLPELRSMFQGMEEADSIALDPHKWLYSPLEAGCTLLKNPQHLIDTYSSHPEYYNFTQSEEGQSLNFFEFGFQNSRGFRALKVWLALQQVGRKGYEEMLQQDIALSELFFALAKAELELEAITQNLSITTLRYVPANLELKENAREEYLNTLNEELLNVTQKAGEVFLSNAVVKGKYCLRGCIVNFRTSEKDIKEIIQILLRVGKQVHARLIQETH
jgi:aromatic-L-amino-acid/L-tryptophan decarboxylase